MELSYDEYYELAFDPRQYDEHDDEWTDEQKAMAEAGKEAAEELRDYNRLTLGVA